MCMHTIEYSKNFKILQVKSIQMARDPGKKKNQIPDEDNSSKVAQFKYTPGSRFYRIFWHSRVTITDSNNNNNPKSFLHFN